MERFSLCPSCAYCPEVVLDGDTIRIGEAENTVVLKKDEWNVLVDAIKVWAPRSRVKGSPGA